MTQVTIDKNVKNIGKNAFYGCKNLKKVIIKTTKLTKKTVGKNAFKGIHKKATIKVPKKKLNAYKKLLKNAEGIQRTLDIKNGGGIDRRVHSIDDIGNIVTVPSARFKTSYDFTEGCKAAENAKSIDYIFVDPQAQVSRVKYSYIHLFSPGTDSRTADNYLYQNRRYNGTFAIDHLFKDGCIIHAAE